MWEASSDERWAPARAPTKEALLEYWLVASMVQKKAQGSATGLEQALALLSEQASSATRERATEQGLELK